MHDDEIAISEDTARRLITHQFPQWNSLSIRCIASSGTVNAIFRIGDDLTARFPLRLSHPDEVRGFLQREAEAAALLAAHSPVPAPQPVALGEPGFDYPMPWSVRTVDTGGRRCEREGRGGDLRTHDAWVETCLQNSENILEVTTLRTMWRRFRELPRETPDVMTHGDLTPGNLLVSDGRLVSDRRLAGVLDCGGFGPADPALDVIAKDGSEMVLQVVPATEIVDLLPSRNGGRPAEAQHEGIEAALSDVQELREIWATAPLPPTATNWPPSWTNCMRC